MALGPVSHAVVAALNSREVIQGPVVVIVRLPAIPRSFVFGNWCANRVDVK